MKKPIKIVFAGTPEFAVPYLDGLFIDADFSVLAVVTQPDKPSGREQLLTASPVKLEALKHDIKVFQPDKLRADQDIIAEVKQLNPDLLVVVAYGQIIPQDFLNIFPEGCLNVHPSLLPKYRGASPIQNTILNGDTETGVTIMLMDEKMDHGPILAQSYYQLSGTETNESLHQDLAQSGVPLLITTLKDFLAKKIIPQQQDHEQATFCRIIKKEDGAIDFSDTALSIKNKIYAFYPWPATHGELDGKRIKFFPPVKIIEQQAKPGEIFKLETALAIGCSDKALIIENWQPEGKKMMKNSDYLRGRPEVIGRFFTSKSDNHQDQTNS
jgi:methionyl-tRNA formyltransferase